jgi:hypothetical protein
MESEAPSSTAPQALRGKSLEAALQAVLPDEVRPVVDAALYDALATPRCDASSPSLDEAGSPPSEGPRAMRPHELVGWWDAASRVDEPPSGIRNRQ